MVIDFLKAIRANLFAMRDPRFLQEARTFLSDGSGGFSASSGNHDDLIMAVLLGYQLCLDAGQYPIAWVDPSDSPLTYDQVFGAMASRAAQGVGTSPLYGSIGHQKGPRDISRSFTLHPQNVRPVDIAR